MKFKACTGKLTCESCIQGKITEFQFPKKSGKKTTKILDLVHSDLCGLMHTLHTTGHKRLICIYVYGKFRINSTLNRSNFDLIEVVRL